MRTVHGTACPGARARTTQYGTISYIHDVRRAAIACRPPAAMEQGEHDEASPPKQNVIKNSRVSHLLCPWTFHQPGFQYLMHVRTGQM